MLLLLRIIIYLKLKYKTSRFQNDQGQRITNTVRLWITLRYTVYYRHRNGHDYVTRGNMWAD